MALAQPFCPDRGPLRPRRRRSRRLSLEPLETRLAPAITAGIVGGTLQVVGDAAADVVALRLNPVDPSQLQVDEGNNGSAEFSFSLSAFTSILVDVGAGNDLALLVETFGAFTLAKPTALVGGLGNDTLTGGAGNETLDGGEGNDSLSGLAGNDVLSGSDGRDTLLGGAGNDTLLGGGGSDSLDGETGQDLLDGDLDPGEVVIGPEVDNGTLIDNDLLPGTLGQFAFRVGNGGQSGSGVGLADGGVTAQGTTRRFVNQNLLFEFFNFVDVGSNGGAVNLANTTITSPADLATDEAEDVVVSTGTFAGQNGLITWRVETRIDDGSPVVQNIVTFTSTGPLGNLRFINYLDEDIEGFADDILFLSGTPGQPDFEAFTLDGVQRVGFSQSGVYAPGEELVNATYDGWAADKFPDLRSAITGAGTAYSVAGNINTTNLPPFIDPALGQVFGPADVTTAFAWTVNPAATSATITTFLRLIPQDPADVEGDDTLVGGDGDDTLSGGGGNDSMFGNAGVDVLAGGDGADTVVGGPGGDTMQGEAGDDLLVWNNGDGSDLVEGGAGSDTVEVNGGAAAETFTAGPNGARVAFARTTPGPFTLDIGTTERLRVNAGDGDDQLTVGNGLAPLIAVSADGGAGNDTLTGGDGNETLTGGTGADVLRGGAGTDLLAGGDGADTVVGGPGNDTMQGEAGDDLLVWNNGDGSDLVEGGAGSDTVEVNGGAAAETFTAGPNGARVAFARTTPGPFTLDIGTAELLRLNAGDGADTVTLTPTTTTAFEVHGGAPGFGQPSRDALFVNLAGVPSFDLQGTAPDSGQWTFANRQPVTFTGFENLENAFFVKALYCDVLDRLPDGGGFSFWLGQLDAGQASRPQVATALLLSAERRGLVVDQFYLTFLKRLADAAGRAFWVNALLAGVSEATVVVAFVTSAEYTSSHPDNRSYVVGLYTDILGRPAGGVTEAELAGWLQLLGSGIVDRAGLALLFLSSDEAYLLAVNSLYLGFLERTADPGGLQFWFTRVQSGLETPTSLATAFLTSGEYVSQAFRKRCD
jgi:Ca2+-binding RTX toxin-like protein